MFGLDSTALAFVGLAVLGTAGLAYAFLFDKVANEAKQDKRVKSIRNRDVKQASKAASRLQDAAKRKKTVQDSLKELEEKQGKTVRKITLKKMIQQAGLKISIQQFFILSILFGIIATIAAVVGGLGIIPSIGIFFVATLGVPRWVVSFIRKRRFNAFLEEFPNSIDVIVRGVRAGLPFNDCIAIIAKESKEPIKTEFSRMIEAQQMGLPTSQAIAKLHENVPLPEANFFGIVVTIQQSAGGNLSEALGNLSNVLRDRKKMKAKIQAMSAEAKASGGIIGSLPFIVGLLVYLTTPDYISILFTHPTGNMILVGAGLWMAIGIMVMRNMINFDF